MKKTITSIISAAILSIGGMFGYYDNKLAGTEATITNIQSELNTTQIELNDAKESKSKILKDYVFSQIRLYETPSIDLTFATPAEVQQAYIDLIADKKIQLQSNDNAFIRLREKVVAEGTACVIK